MKVETRTPLYVVTWNGDHAQARVYRSFVQKEVDKFLGSLPGNITGMEVVDGDTMRQLPISVTTALYNQTVEPEVRIQKFKDKTTGIKRVFPLLHKLANPIDESLPRDSLQGRDEEQAEDAEAEQQKKKRSSRGSGRKPGSGAYIRELLMQDDGNGACAHTKEEIVALVHEKFEGVSTTVRDVSWNHWKLKKEEQNPPALRG